MPDDATSEAASRRQLGSRFSCKGMGNGRSDTGSVTKLMATDAAATPRPPRDQTKTEALHGDLPDQSEPARAQGPAESTSRDGEPPRRRAEGPEILAQTMSRKVPTSP